MFYFMKSTNVSQEYYPSIIDKNGLASRMWPAGRSLEAPDLQYQRLKLNTLKTKRQELSTVSINWQYLWEWQLNVDCVPNREWEIS